MNIHLFRKIILCIISLIGFCAMNASRIEAVQEPQTLKLVKIYQSKEEYLEAYSETFPQHRIIDNEGYLQFVNIKTGSIAKQVKKEEFVLTDA